MTRSLFLSISLFLLAACGGGPGVEDGGALDSSTSHDAASDALATDAFVADGGTVDAGGDAGIVVDAAVDASTDDAAVADAGGDAAVADASGDAAAADAGGMDAGGDAAVADAGGDAATTGDAATCSIVGDYSLTFMGMTAYFRFAADGTWAGSPDRAGLDAPIAHGPYTFLGATMTLTENDGTASCAVTDLGTYTVTFDAACAGLTLTLVSDACGARGTVLGGAHLVRLP